MTKRINLNFEIDSISFSEKENAFIVDYTIYDDKGRPIISDTTMIDHVGSVDDTHYTTIEAIKNILKGKIYGTKIKN
jgi:hypothetical protein